MSDQELAQAMRDLIARHSLGLPDARQLSAEVMRRDSGQIRLLALASVFFWVVAAAGLLFLIFVLHHGLLILAVLIVPLLLAALFTILLVFSSRRATLRQINISLMEISEQLKQLRRPPPA
jgi:Flp pilus assembly protein TadB